MVKSKRMMETDKKTGIKRQFMPVTHVSAVLGLREFIQGNFFQADFDRVMGMLQEHYDKASAEIDQKAENIEKYANEKIAEFDGKLSDSNKRMTALEKEIQETQQIIEENDIPTRQEISANVINIITGKDEVEMIFNFDLKNKVAGSFVENKNTYRYTSVVSGALPTNPAIGTELGNAGDWSDYSAVGALDDKLFTTNTPAVTRNALHLIRWNILGVVKEMLGDNFFATFGAETSNDQLSLIRKKSSSLTMGVWGYGKNQSGNRLTIKTQRASDSAWAYEGYHTKSTVQKLTTTIIPTSIPYYINDDGFVTVGAYAEPSDGTVESMTRIDYANAEFRMKLSMDEYLKALIAAYHREMGLSNMVFKKVGEV